MVANNTRFNIIEKLFPAYAKEIYDKATEAVTKALRVFKNKNNLNYKKRD